MLGAATVCVVVGVVVGATLAWSGGGGGTAGAQVSSASPVWAAACGGSLVPTTPGVVAEPAVREASGIAAGRRNPGVWWVHNDSGDSARVFAMGDDGRALGQFTLAGAAARDWEDIAVGPGPVPGVAYLHVGDIGDNSAVRPSVVVYRVAEPAVPGPVGTRSLTGVEALTLTYPDGPRDAEALLVDPVSGDLFVIAKTWTGRAGVYRAPAGLAAGSSTVLTLVGTFPLGIVTGADVTPLGDVVAVRTYGSVVLYRRAPGTGLGAAFAGPSCVGPSASEAQGEAVGFLPDGSGYLTVSEGAGVAIRRFAPRTAPPTVTVPAPPTTRPAVTPTTRPAVTPTTRPAVTPTTRPAVTPTTRPAVTPTTRPTATTRPRPTATTRPRTAPKTAPAPAAR